MIVMPVLYLFLAPFSAVLHIDASKSLSHWFLVTVHQSHDTYIAVFHLDYPALLVNSTIGRSANASASSFSSTSFDMSLSIMLDKTSANILKAANGVVS